MIKRRAKKMLPVALMLMAVAVSIAAIVSLVRFVASSSGVGSSVRTEDVLKVELLDTSAGKRVNMTVRGPIVSDEDFVSYKIEITPSSRSLTVYKGYKNEVTKQVTFANNIPAYEQFVYSLNKANFTRGSQIGKTSDLRGVCASGYLYEFNVLEDDIASETINTWHSACSGSKGTLGASIDQIERLFRLQIPESKKIISEIW